MNYTQHKWISSGVIAMAALALSGCIKNSSSRAAYSSSLGSVIVSSASPTTATSPTPTPTSSNSASLGDLIETRVGAVGYTATTVKVKARKVLKLQFTPGVQDETMSGSDEMPKYSGLGVYISVNGTTQSTPLLYNGFYGGAAQSSGTLDFSSAIPQSVCTTTDDACREDVTITVLRPNSDWYCLNYGIGCPWTRVQAGHPWNGTLKIQTDDTQAL